MFCVKRDMQNIIVSGRSAISSSTEDINNDVLVSIDGRCVQEV